MPKKHDMYKQGWILVLMALVAGAALSESHIAGMDRDALLAKLDQAQQQLDAARTRLTQGADSSASLVQLDNAQKMLDAARARLTGGPTPQDDPLSRDSLLQSLTTSQNDLDQARQRLSKQPGTEASIALLEESQKRLDATREWLEGASDTALLEVPGKDQMRAMFARARQHLDEARAKIMSAPRIDQLALRRLEEAEKTLEKARRDSVKLGLMD